MKAMRANQWSAVLLIGFLVLTPFVSASTREVWTDGIYDAELNGLVHALKSADGVIDCAPPARRACSSRCESHREH
jgi:hypothetical protein